MVCLNILFTSKKKALIGQIFRETNVICGLGITEVTRNGTASIDSLNIFYVDTYVKNLKSFLFRWTLRMVGTISSIWQIHLVLVSPLLKKWYNILSR